jgi:hypothetical protein
MWDEIAAVRNGGNVTGLFQVCWIHNRKPNYKLGAVVQVCNPSYLEVGIRRIIVQGQPGEKFMRPLPNLWLCAMVCTCHFN